MMDGPQWTPDLVEDLMFRQFINNEDVSRLLPPAPKLVNENYLDRYEEATKVLFAYVRNGPVAALSSQNVNTAVGKNYSGAPAKVLIQRTPISKPPMEAPRTHVRTPTPKGKDSTRATSATKTSVTPPPHRSKRERIEWPADVPTNAMLKSNSRSKVAPITTKRVAAQQSVDPDLIFRQNPGDLPLNAMFAQYPKALKAIAATRGISGDWRNDTFTAEEEQLYKKELGYTHLGPSQCVYGAAPFTPS